MGLGLGLTKHRKTLFLRRQSTQLQEVVSRVQELRLPGERFPRSGHGGLLTTYDGRTIEFAGCDHETEKQKYKGRAHDLKFWDEVVDFPESVYTFVNGWNRTTVPNQRCRVVAASNPPTTAEGEWVIRRWAPWLDPSCGNRAGPMELRWFTTVDGKEQEFAGPQPVRYKQMVLYPRSRSFIPADMLDVLVKTGYANQLATMPEPLRSIYLEGDFGAAKQDGRWQLIPTRWVEQANARWEERYKNRGEVRAVGADPSRGGSDQAAVAPRYGATDPNKGAVIGPVTRKPGKQILKGDDMLPLIRLAGGGVKGVPTNVDAIGIGASVIDCAKLLSVPDIVAIVVSNSTGWRDPKIPKIGFVNLRAAMMWNVACLLDPDRGPPETRLALPPDPEMKADLTAPNYSMTTKGVKVESKEDIRDRIGRSTDVGDAVALACWVQPQGGFALV